MEPIIELRGLGKHFGDFVAVNGLDLTVTRGDVYGFLGPNGAGKTTTLRLLVGLLRADAGSIRICGTDLRSAPTAALEHIGALIETPVFHENLSAVGNLRLGTGLIPSLRRDRA